MTVCTQWVSLIFLTASLCSCNSFLIQPLEVLVPVQQIFAMGASGQGKTDNDGQAFTATHGKKEVVMSKSVSFSRVSMKIGGVSVANNSISQDQEKTATVKKKLKVINPGDSQMIHKNVFDFNILSSISIASGTELNNGEEDEDTIEEYQLVYRDIHDYGEKNSVNSRNRSYYENASRYLYEGHNDQGVAHEVDINALSIIAYDVETDYNESDHQVESMSIHSDAKNDVDSKNRITSLINKVAMPTNREIKVKSTWMDQKLDKDVATNLFNLNSYADVENQNEMEVRNKNLVENFLSNIFNMIGLTLGLITLSVTVIFSGLLVFLAWRTRRKAKRCKVAEEDLTSSTESQTALKISFNIGQHQEYFKQSDDIFSVDNDSFLSSLETMEATPVKDHVQ